MSKLTGAILAHDEINLLKKCIGQLSFCDEVVVIDDSLTDQISEIAKYSGAKVFKHALNTDFSQQRNFALSVAKGDWVLFIDPDEVVSKDLAREIKEKIKLAKVDGYYIKRKDVWQGKQMKYGEVGEICLIRLAKRKKGKWLRAVHEHWFIKGKTDTLQNVLLHYPHPTLAEFINKINYYSFLHAQENDKEGKKPNYINVIIYPLGKFIKFYFLKLGFLDGVHGFVIAVLMAFHSYLAWSTQWIQNNYSKYNAS